ncbi:hypothetical protein [Hyphomicrobium sp.]|uniref:hypothetical protein n=1 Tax=Hyphomicrobium sp. TaxID=82 RepID=UPI002E32F913|nr:hypothetical protein [Hyphomicrobium sp.]HEX2843335.1 hypothetical protein [Hyphomicrobium sp.]
MSLFRIAVVLSLGVALMPSDREQQEALYERAATAAHWTMTYCDRNGQQCEMAGTLWDAFLRKAQFAGKLAYDVALRTAGNEAQEALIAPVSAKARGTLSPDDLSLDWRGERTQQGGI